jgi:hypothetical protein
MSVPPPRAMPNHSKKVLENASIHFGNILTFINQMKQQETSISEFNTGFQEQGGRWSEINVPHFDIPRIDTDNS